MRAQGKCPPQLSHRYTTPYWPRPSSLPSLGFPARHKSLQSAPKSTFFPPAHSSGSAPGPAAELEVPGWSLEFAVEIQPGSPLLPGEEGREQGKRSQRDPHRAAAHPAGICSPGRAGPAEERGPSSPSATGPPSSPAGPSGRPPAARDTTHSPATFRDALHI